MIQNLSNITLRIGFTHNILASLLSYDDSIENYKVIDGDEARMMIEMSKHFNFSIQWKHSKRFGILTENNTWTGLFGMFQQNEIDLAIGGILQTYNRQMIADFLYPHFIDKSTFAIQPSNTIDYNSDYVRFNLLIRPFTLDVWLAFLFILILFGFLNFFLKLIPNTNKKIKHNIIWINLCLLTGQPYTLMKFTPISVRLSAIIWAFGIKILYNYYQGSLCSILTIQDDNIIDTIDELAMASKTGLVLPMLVSHSSSASILSESQIQSYKTIYKNSISIADRSDGYELMNHQKQLPKSNRKIYVFIGPRQKLEFYRLYYADQPLFIPPILDQSIFNMVFYSIPVRKGFDPFHKSICRIKHSGIHEHWKLMALINAVMNARSKWNNNDDDNLDQQFSLNQLNSIFYSYLILLVIAIIAFMIELINQFLLSIETKFNNDK
ncbi:hypothetical protein DERP_000867 [Dermatophagoides pteronyssinus]|uniref:Uncharacterized protein n=1 Tax=Dermatophagoides pteronyssinus TaxID=6956 RepID=A0ABQ8J1C9_DERPT|nr:hypothetical protein DERP_000867 [Dermatophagoides pteronyssinus]